MSASKRLYAVKKPVLPEDVIRIVIAEYCKTPNAKALDLLTVSRTAFRWASAHLYHTIVLVNEAQAFSFVEAVNGLHRYCKPNKHMKCLWLHGRAGDDPTSSEVLEVISKCQNLCHLSHVPWRNPIPKCSPSKPPSLTRLTVYHANDRWRDADIERTIMYLGVKLQNLTHLQFVCVQSFAFEFLDENASVLTSLTHLALDLSLFELFATGFRSDVKTLFFWDSDYPHIKLLRGLYNRIPSLQEIIVTLTDMHSLRGAELIRGDIHKRPRPAVLFVIVDDDIKLWNKAPLKSIRVRPCRPPGGVAYRMKLSLRTWE